MKRPLIACAAGVAAGILLAGSPWPVLLLCAGMLILSGVSTGRRHDRFSQWRTTWGLFVLFLVLGFFRHEWTLAQIQYRYAAWQDETVTVVGTVVDTPAATTAGWMLTVRVEALCPGNVCLEGVSSPGAYVAEESSVFEPGGRMRVYAYDAPLPPGLVYGQRVRLVGSVRLPAWRRNPGGFNAAMYLAARGVAGELTLRDGPEVLPGWAGHPLVRLGLRARAAAIGRMSSLMPPQEAAVLSGMLLGETEEMDAGLSNAFRMAGLSHLMAVSGANIAFVLLPLMWLLRRMGVNRRRAGACAIPLLLFYVLMTGFEASIVRAACMAVLMLCGHLLWRKTDMASSLGGACCVMLLANSAWLFDVGFALSFLATSAIGLFCEPLVERMPAGMPRGLRETVAGSLSAQAGVLPVQLLTFHTLNPYALPANLVVVPATGLLTCGAALLLLASVILPTLAVPFGQGMGMATGWLCRLVRWTAGLPGAERTLAAPRVLLVLLYALWLLLPRFARPLLDKAQRRRLYAAAGLATMVFGWTALKPVPVLRVTVADVGQGDAILVQTPAGGSLLIDGGGQAADASGQRVGERIVLPLLRRQGIMAPDLLVSTHPHVDHLQGLEVVLDRAGAGGVAIPAGLDGYDAPDGLPARAAEKGIPVHRAQPGDILWEEPELQLRVLSVLVSEVDVNEASMVLLLSYREFSMLLMADAGLVAEKWLCDAGLLQDVAVLKVGHHGSQSATGARFLSRTRPEEAVVSVGKNRYGHPSSEVVDRLRAHGAAVHQTRDGGAWLLRTNGHTWQSRAFVRPRRTVFARMYRTYPTMPAGLNLRDPV